MYFLITQEDTIYKDITFFENINQKILNFYMICEK